MIFRKLCLENQGNTVLNVAKFTVAHSVLLKISGCSSHTLCSLPSMLAPDMKTKDDAENNIFIHLQKNAY